MTDVSRILSCKNTYRGLKKVESMEEIGDEIVSIAMP